MPSKRRVDVASGSYSVTTTQDSVDTSATTTLGEGSAPMERYLSRLPI